MPRDPPGNRRAFASYPTPIVTEVSEQLVSLGVYMGRDNGGKIRYASLGEN
jgi:hypothetical protein